MTKKNKLSSTELALKHGYRAGNEYELSEKLSSYSHISFEYEPFKLGFLQPAKERSYTPDFVLTFKDSGKIMIIEAKGRFTVEDRQKHLMIRNSLPQLDVRFVFTNAKAKISKTSKTTYAQWCDKNGFKWSHKVIPEEWLNG